MERRDVDGDDIAALASLERADAVGLPQGGGTAECRHADDLWGGQGARPDARLVQERDEAQLENSSTRNRNNSENLGMPQMLGLESSITRILPNTVNPANLVTASSTAGSTGTGQIQRNETVTLRVAAVR